MQMRTRLMVFWSMLLLVVGSCLLVLAYGQSSVQSSASTAASLHVESVASPASANSSEPHFTLQGDRVILSWVEVNGDRAALKFAERTAAGWTNAQTAASGTNFFVNSFDVPSVHALADGSLAAHWEERLGEDEDSDASKVMLSWSKDQGHTWSKPVTPHHDNTMTEHGFVSLFQAPGAGLGLVWIDGRATNPDTESGDMALRAAIYDAAGKQLRETVVAPRVCECCSTSVTETAEGPIVAFRNRSAAEVRDIYVTRLANGAWSPPVNVHADGWKINACPINGPSVAARGRDVAVAWFMAKNDQGQAFVAFSHDAGRTFGAPVRVDDAGSLGRLGVQMLDDGSAAVIWIEKSSPRTQMRLRVVSAAGMRSAPVTVADTEGSRYPRMMRRGNELLFAWTDTDKGSQLRTARVKLAPPHAGAAR
ncbi:MAG TPA: sialidase family protein [Candidatus Acidoferrales bacterium]|nr:sialidase family protein [Candidatus Acidoferrales bacterium]